MKTNLTLKKLPLLLLLLSPGPLLHARTAAGELTGPDEGQAFTRPATRVEGKRAAATHFMENRGQITDQFGTPRGDIDFKLGSEGVNIFIGSEGLHYQWSRDARPEEKPARGEGSLDMYRMDVTLVGANRQARVVRDGRTSYFERYYTRGLNGVVSNGWNRITYKEVYPGIDWVLYMKNGRLEYDFVVRPGGKISDIRLRYEGAGSLQINRDGSVTAVTPYGSVTEAAPVSFQADGGKVSSRFVLQDHTLGFETDPYEGTLTIDPVLEWATYYGGSAGQDLGRGVAADQAGGVYMTGSTAGGTNLVTTGAHQTTFGAGGTDAFLAKYDSSGALLWATFYGGTGSDAGWMVACDRYYNVYVTGETQSTTGIATSGNSHQATMAGGGKDAFLVKFDSSGVRRWGTYYGGTGSDEGWGVDCDKAGNVFISGRTTSTTGIATNGTHQATLGGSTDAFVARFDSTGTRLWGTYVGGTGSDLNYALVCDTSGNVYITGETGSTNGISTPGGHKTTGPSNGTDAFLVKISSSGARLWGTYYGGNNQGQVWGADVAVDDRNYVYMTGYGASTGDIATPGSHQPVSPSGFSSFLVKFDESGTRSWGTYYGGTGTENGYGVDCDLWGNVYVTGYTTSPDNIATTGAAQYTPGGGNDFYIVKFNREGVRQWGTYYGGPGYDAGWSVAADIFGNIYACGFIGSSNMAYGNAAQSVFGGGSFDAFLIRISDCKPAMQPEGIAGPDSLCADADAVYHVVPADPNGYYVWTLPSGWTGSSNSDSIAVSAAATGGVIKVVAVGNCNVSEAYSKTVGIYPAPNFMISVNGTVLGTTAPFPAYQWYVNGLRIDGATDSFYTVTYNASYSVRITDVNGCEFFSAPYSVNNVSVAGMDAEAAVHIYPNPASDRVYIRSAAPVQVLIRSLDGRIVAHTNDGAGSVGIGELAEGVYMIQVMDREGRQLLTERLVKTGK